MKKALIHLLSLTLAQGLSAQTLKPAAKADGSNIEASPFLNALGGTTAGKALFTLPNPSSIAFPRVNADNTATLLSAGAFKTALSLSKSDVGLGNVDNTSDANKPVSTATQTALDAKVNTSALSTNGGVNAVLKTDGQGNLIIGTAVTEASSGFGQTNYNRLTGTNGNLFLTDDKFIGWMASDNPTGGVYGFSPSGGKIYAAIRFDRGHDASYGEWNFDTNSRICWYWNDGMQFGNAGGGSHYIYLHSGTATAGSTMLGSVPILFNTSTYSGGSATLNQVGIQAKPSDVTGTNSGFSFQRNCAPGVTQSPGGTEFAFIGPEGVWSNGTAPAFDTLTATANVFTQVCSRYKTVQTAKLTLGATNTLAITGATAGMRGVIYVAQDPAGGRSLTMPTGSALPSSWTLSSLGNKIDRLEWEFDGTFYYWSQQVGINLPLDSDAQSFITTTGITDDTIKTALNNLVLSLKAGGVWSQWLAFYPMVGGTASTHSYNLKNPGVYQITWSGSGMSHDSKGAKGDGAAGYGNTGVTPAAVQAVAGNINSMALYVYCRTQTPADNKCLLAAIDYTSTTSRNTLARSGVNASVTGLNNNVGGTTVGVSDYRTHLFANRSASTTLILEKGIAPSVTSGSDNSNATTFAGAQPFYLLARNAGGTADQFSDATLGPVGIATSLDSTQRAAVRSAVAAFEAAIARPAVP